LTLHEYLAGCAIARLINDHGWERLSFKGSVDAVRHFSGAIARARSKSRAAALHIRRRQGHSE
jgi:hypothetical protein